MGCVLRAMGRTFDVDAFVRESTLVTDSIYHRGELRLAGATGPRHSASGLGIQISDADFDDLAGQIQGALEFLNEHEDELRHLTGFVGVEEVCLDFGVSLRNAAKESEVFPADLLWRAGALDIDLVVTHYTIANEASE